MIDLVWILSLKYLFEYYGNKFIMKQKIIIISLVKNFKY